MVLMAGAFGADQRLVAFMQYLRVIFVSMTAALVARVDTSGIEIPAIIWFPPIDPLAFAATLGVALVGSLIGKLFRLPSPFFLGTFIFGTAVHLGLGVTMQLPPWLLALGYTMIGWTIGLNFTRAILRHATRALPQIVGSIIILIAFCGGLGFMISHVLGIDPLTAYLATSPGGMDSVAIIAAAALPARRLRYDGTQGLRLGKRHAAWHNFAVADAKIVDRLDDKLAIKRLDRRLWLWGRGTTRRPFFHDDGKEANRKRQGKECQQA